MCSYPTGTQRLFGKAGRPRMALAACAATLPLLAGGPLSRAQEACCFSNGTCTEVIPADCTADGGSPRGPGSTCPGVICPASQDCQSPNLAIPDNTPAPAGISGDIMIADGGVVCDVNVYVRVDHTWVGDLSMALEHVDTGTQVTIYDRPGVPASMLGCMGNNLEIILDDEATIPIENACGLGVPTQFGAFVPNNPLSAFDGEDAAGFWGLTVSDNAVIDTGTFEAWCVIITLDSDGDGVCDDVDICEGDDATGDSDGDGVCDDIDACDGDDATGDSDGDGVCDDIDACNGDDATGDSDGDGVCDDIDPCPSDAGDDSDGDGVCDSDDVCPGGDDTVDTDADGTPDDCDDTPAGQTACCGGGLPMLMPFMLLGWGWMRRRRMP